MNLLGLISPRPRFSVFGFRPLCGLFATVTCCLLGSFSSAAQPNIIYIMADDLGYADIGPFGQKKIRTPNLDQFAREGMCFDQFYPGGSVCSPTRTALMTGLHTGHTWIRGNHGRAGLSRVPLRPQDLTVAEHLKSAGYATALAGKWGLGEPGTTGVPNRKGFDRFFGYLNNDLAEDYFPAKIWKNETEITLPGNVDGKKGQFTNDLMTDEALAFIDDNRTKPFFLYLAYTIPHAVWEVPADSIADYTGKWEEPTPDVRDDKVMVKAPRATYAAMVTRLDRQVGRVLEKLRRLDLEQNTIVFFCSDNGAPNRAGIPQFFGSMGPFRGFKGSLYEGGIHTHMIVRWPGQVPAGRRSDFPLAGWDFLPTAAALAGAPAPKHTDGMNVLPALRGQTLQRDGYLYWENVENKFSQAVRLGDLKAIRPEPGAAIEVYDLRADPGEAKNLAATRADIVARAEELFRTGRTESEHWPLNKPAKPGKEKRSKSTNP